MELRSIEGVLSGKLFPLSKNGVTIGRDLKSSISLTDDDDISRNHARIVYDGLNYYVEDLKSTNGVRVNGAQIQGRQLLAPGDRVGIGSHVFLTVTEESVVAEGDLSKLEALRREREAKQESARREPAAADPKTGISAGEIGLWIGIAVVALGVMGWLLSGSRAPSAPVPLDREVILAAEPPAQPPVAERPRQRILEPPALVEETTKEPETGYLWVDSVPRGAVVSLNGSPIGISPIFIEELTEGEHELELNLENHVTRAKLVRVPLRRPLAPLNLTRSPQTCEITSKPSGVTVIEADRIIGRTPMTLLGYKPGQHELRLVESGYEPQTIMAQVKSLRATQAHAVMTAATGTLKVTAVPATCSLRVNGEVWGTTEPSPDGGHSLPWISENLRPGTYTVEIEHAGITETRKVRLAPRGLTDVELIIFRPTVAVKLIDGRTLIGMVRERNAHGDIVLALSASRDTRLLASQIVSIAPIPVNE